MQRPLLKNLVLMVFLLAIVVCYMHYPRNNTAQLVVPVTSSQIRNSNLVPQDTDQTPYYSLTNNSSHTSDQPQLVTTAQPTESVINSTDVNHQQPQGHILVYSSYEEQTNGARNLWQLHMWAAILKMRVVEPFAVESMFGVIGALPNFTQALQFSDYYDTDKWNKLVKDHGGSSLVHWKDFLSNAPRKVIILYTLLRYLGGKPFSVTYGEDDINKTYNPTKYEHIATEDMTWLKQNFNITRVVNFIRDGNVEHPLSPEEFNSYVFGDIDPTEVTLIIINWIGISTTRWRIQLKRTSYISYLNAMHVDFRIPQSLPKISPSWRVLKAYKNYVSKYIGNRKYVGIIFRTHCVLEYGVKGDFKTKSQYLLGCSKQLKHTLDKVRNKWRIFMAYDLGTFGSDGYYSAGDQRLFPLRDQIFSDVFNGSISMNQRDEMLMNVSDGISDRGFIALLEKTITTNADCIILLGKGSSFVSSSADEYFFHHPSNSCAVSICSEKFTNVDKTESSTSNIPDKYLHL